MSQTFTGAATEWSDFLDSTPSFTADVISTDSNTTNVTYNPAPPSISNNPINNRMIRVTKPTRKRSRVSRRTPTTLMSTNTSNFRAMVQQFTGGPSAGGFGLGTGTENSAIDHLQPLRVTDQQPRGVDGSYGYPWSAYGFQVHHHLPVTEQAAYGVGSANAKREGGVGGSSFLY